MSLLLLSCAGASAANGPLSVRVVSLQAPLLAHPAPSAQIVATLDAGSVLQVVDTQQEWYEVLLTSANNVISGPGWISLHDVEVMPVRNPATAGDDFARRIHDLQVQLDQQQSFRDTQMAPKPRPLKAQRSPDAQPLSDTQHLSDGQSLLKAQRLAKAQRLLEAARDRDRAQRESSEIPPTNAAVAAESAVPGDMPGASESKH